MGRKARSNDPEAIRALIGQLGGDDVGARIQAVHRLSAEHGEYAVPQLLYALADPDDGDRRAVHINTLSRMGDDVVLPLLAALDSSDAFLRRNICHTLGYIGDPRANGWLAARASGDADEGVRGAAAEALAKCGGNSNAVGQLLAIGNAWHAGDPSVLLPHQISDVVWQWQDNTIVPLEIPAYLYNEELAKNAYHAALAVDPNSTEAMAGIARASVAQHEDLVARAGAGVDTGDWAERLATGDLAIQLAGAGALDLALLWALEAGDEVAASGLCRALAMAASGPTQGLQAALVSSNSGAVRGEAAIALGTIAYHTSSAAGADTVAALAEAAGREVLQLAAVIDAQNGRRQNLSQALTDQGMSVSAWSTGARGLASLRQVPGVDVLLIAETLPDLTFAQVVDEIRTDPALANTPVLILAEDGDAAKELWGERVTEAVTSPDDVGKVSEALSGSMNRDREEANRLAAAAAHTLHLLAGAGHTDVGAAAGSLAGTLAMRPDEVVVPALGALGACGTAAQVSAIAAVLSDDGRSEGAREAAGLSLAGIFARNPRAADESTLQALNAVATSDAPFGVRRAAAVALGRLDLSPDMRSGLVRSVRSNLSGE